MNNAIVVHGTGFVQFSNYDELLHQATELAEHVSTVVVTEESVKATKKMLAEVNKKVNALEDERKQIKKELLQPYEEFEKKVKAITSVVKDADKIVRDQVKELEEQERQSKHGDVSAIFYKRIKRYPELEMFNDFDFIKASHLNKSTSMKKVEEEMVEWFEHRKQDVEFIKEHKHGEDILVEYQKTQDVIRSIQIVGDRLKAKQQINKTESVKQEQSVNIVINVNDLATVKALLQATNITFEIKN